MSEELIHLAGHAEPGNKQRCCRCGIILAKWAFYPVGESVAMLDSAAVRTSAKPTCPVPPLRAKDLRRHV